MSDTDPYAPKSSSTEKVELSAEQAEVEEKRDEVPKGTVNEVKEWVGDDKDRAQQALDAEKAGAERVTLIDFLEEKLNEK